MSKYEVIIYWSKDDQAFIAEVPELGGTYVFPSRGSSLLAASAH